MLLQSHESAIELLPALPDNWKNGHFKGLVARGGFVFDAKWENGKLTEFKVYSKADNICRIRLTKQPLNSPDESSYSNGVLTFNAVAKRTYYFSFN